MFLSSINIISILAFFVTFIFLAYEFYIFYKERQKKSSIVIPDFKANVHITSSNSTVIQEEKKNIIKKGNQAPLAIGLILLIFFATISIIGLVASRQKSEGKTSITPSPIVSFASSKGLKFYTLDWKELPEDSIMSIATKSAIIIGIGSVPGADIDKARIRINEHEWTQDSITTKFYKKEDVFYKEFQISSFEGGLRIEAQLHSKKDGWLEE